MAGCGVRGGALEVEMKIRIITGDREGIICYRCFGIRFGVLHLYLFKWLKNNFFAFFGVRNAEVGKGHWLIWRENVSGLEKNKR